MDSNDIHDEKIQLNVDELRQTLNIESGKLSWQELQVHFARGVVVIIDTNLDLIEVSTKFVQDDKSAIEELMVNNRVRNATDDDARTWVKTEPEFWAVVVPPWVLVQEI